MGTMCLLPPKRARKTVGRCVEVTARCSSALPWISCVATRLPRRCHCPSPLNPPTGATQQSWESQEDNSLQILLPPKKCSNLRAIFWLYCWNGVQTGGQQFGTSVSVMEWLMPKSSLKFTQMAQYNQVMIFHLANCNHIPRCSYNFVFMALWGTIC